MTRREYRAGIPTTLSADITSSSNPITVDTYTNWPTGSGGNFWITIDAGKPQEERILCSAQSSGSITVAASGRGQDGTTASSHTKGATVWPSWSAQDADESNAHIEATGYASFSKSVHGLGSGDGVVVGTDKTQTLTAKTLTSPTINTPTINTPTISSPTISGTITGAVVTSANIVDGTIVNADINAGAAIAQSKISGLTTDLGLKAPLADPTFTGTVVLPSTTSIGNVTSTEIGYVDGVTSAIQTQLNAKASTSDLSTHEADTTSIHGISDTSKLAKFGSSAAGRTIFVQTTTPTALATGDIWIDY